jgi:hypothetical protein
MKAAGAHIESMYDQSNLKWDIHTYGQARATRKSWNVTTEDMGGPASSRSNITRTSS